MDFTQFEKDWIIELVQEELSRQEEKGHVFQADKDAFESILKKLKQD